VRSRVAIVYNEPVPSQYRPEEKKEAIVGILNSVKAVHQALLLSGYDVIEVPLLPPIERAGEELKGLSADLVFNLFEGFAGSSETEAVVAEVIAGLGIPYTGCPAETLALALDKAKTKEILEEAGFATPRYQLLSPETMSEFHLNYPCIVKPCNEDASSGLSEKSVVYDFTSLEEQVKAVSKLFEGAPVLVEEFIDGREFNATILGNSEYITLPVSEIAYQLPPEMPKILTSAAKWEPESLYFQGTKAVCPAPVPDEEREHIAGTALDVFHLFSCRGYARVDMRRGRGEQLNIIELNPNPDISPDSGAALQAKTAGMDYPKFINKIARLALEKN
jgi:D-alanine-D-alanine ligase